MLFSLPLRVNTVPRVRQVGLLLNVQDQVSVSHILKREEAPRPLLNLNLNWHLSEGVGLKNTLPHPLPLPVFSLEKK